jgi:hypothetical protein
MVGCAKRNFDGIIKYIFFVPLYWLGMSVAAWKAMYEMVVKPHYWAKTVHGLHLAPGALVPVLAPAFAPTRVPHAQPILLETLSEYKKQPAMASALKPNKFGATAMPTMFVSLRSVRVATFISYGRRKGGGARISFNKLLIATATLVADAGLTLVASAPYLMSLLFGPGSANILPYVPAFIASVVLFTISTTVVLYRILQNEYIFSVLFFVVTGLLVEGLMSSHSSVDLFVRVFLGINMYYFLFILLVHTFYSEFKLMTRDIRDLLLVFAPLPKAPILRAGRMRILIFNWHDTQKIFASGEGSYVHSLAEQWAADGHSVTLFTSNDYHQKEGGNPHGVRVLRRGGFYTVYLLAQVYYHCVFRGKFDILVDCKSGVPLFKQLYAKKPMYSLKLDHA